MRPASSLLHSEKAQSIVEMAIAFNVLLGFVFVLIELCLLLYSLGMISESAREATRYAIVHGATCTTSGNASCTASAATVQSFISNLGWPNPGGGTLTPTVTFPDGNQSPGSRVLVSISYSFPVHIPLVARTSLTLTTSSEMYILQ